MKSLVTASIAFLFIFSAYAQPLVKWHQSFGGTENENFTDLKKTSDGGYIAVGSAISTNGDLAGRVYDTQGDYWIVKLDSNKNVQWKQTYGGSNADGARKVIVPSDNSGFVVMGFTDSKDRDVAASKGGRDVWVMKLDNSGSIVWQRNYGGSHTDEGIGMVESQDNYIIAAHSTSADGDVGGDTSIRSLWIFKIRSSGDIIWSKTFKGSRGAVCYSLAETNDAGCIAGAYSQSKDGDFPANKSAPGGGDVWMLKMDKDGNLQWKKNYGGSNDEVPLNVLQTKDDGYVFVGTTRSKDQDIKGFISTSEIAGWMVKLDKNGNIAWSKLGIRQSFKHIAQLSDGGYMLTGDIDTSGLGLEKRTWLSRLDASGAIIWEGIYGALKYNEVRSLVSAGDSTYLFASTIRSGDGDAAGSGYHKGEDVWVAELGWFPLNVNTVGNSAIVVYPIPTNGNVHVSLPEGCEYARIKLVNMSGQVMDVRFDGSNSVKIASLQNIPAGRYILHISNDNLHLSYNIVYMR